MRSVEVQVAGPGSGRESAVRALSTAGIEVRAIRMSPRSHTTAAARRNGGASDLSDLPPGWQQPGIGAL